MRTTKALPNILRYRYPLTARAMTHTCSTQHYSNSFPKFSLSKQEVKKNPGNEVVLFKCRKRSCVKTFSSEILHYFIRYLDCKKQKLMENTVLLDPHTLFQPNCNSSETTLLRCMIVHSLFRSLDRLAR